MILATAGRRARRGLRRLRRRHLHQRAQHRRDLRHPEALRGAPRRCPRTRSWPTCAARCSRCARPSCSCSSRPRCRASAPAAASRATCRTAPRAACRRSRAPPGRWPAPPGRRRASPRPSRCSTRARRRSGPRSTAPRPSSSACRSRACSRRCRSTWARRYVNDFNILGRTYRVTAQADNPYRLTLRDVANLKTRNASGEMVPIGSVATFSDTTGPYRVARYNLYPAAEVQVGAAARLLLGPGHRRHRGAGREGAALGLRLRMDRDRAAGEARRQHRRSWPSAWPWCSCSCCWPRSTRAGCCRSPSS